MVIRWTFGTHPVAINGGVVTNFTTKNLSIIVQASRLVPHATTRFAIFVINEGINNHCLKKFEDEDQEVVAILVEASGTKQDKLWILQK